MSDGFVRIAACDELPEGIGIPYIVGNREIGLFKLVGEVCAINGVCPHVGGPLGEGFVENGKVYCPMHGWPFDLWTGQCASNPGVKVDCFETKVKDGEVFVRLSE
ncbi:MAG TPA: nitrite reductase (NAD(P)H) small subunit [Verrucomicrobiota bacterium]|nr:nitrite reductase (NAD(P)H) small subunit [Verrucomicrobiota bacterium]|tara:strand:+ start:257 stop:571 length:315 start_codon:yes stop_codon:yes gene_type:complete